MVSEESLHLLRVPAGPEKRGRAAVPEAVEASPRDTSCARRRLEDAVEEVAPIERRAGAGGEDELAVAGASRHLAELPESLRHAGCDGDIAAAVATLRR